MRLCHAHSASSASGRKTSSSRYGYAMSHCSHSAHSGNGPSPSDNGTSEPQPGQARQSWAEFWRTQLRAGCDGIIRVRKCGSPWSSCCTCLRGGGAGASDLGNSAWRPRSELVHGLGPLNPHPPNVPRHRSPRRRRGLREVIPHRHGFSEDSEAVARPPVVVGSRRSRATPPRPPLL